MNINISKNILIPNYIKYKWNIKYTSHNKNYNTDIFPLKLYIKYFTKYHNVIKMIGYNFIQFAYDTDYNKYLSFYYRSSHMIKYSQAMFNNRIINTTVDNIIRPIKQTNKINTIIDYKFEHISSINFYEAISEHNMINPKDKIMIFCKNIMALDAITYYQKYINYKFKKNNITILLEKYKSDNILYNYSLKFIKKISIDPIIIEDPLNNSNINKIINKLKNDDLYDFIMIDFNILIPELYYKQDNYNIQSIISRLIIALDLLNNNGNLFLYMVPFSNKLGMDIICYISSLFKESYIYKNNISPEYEHYTPFIFKGYTGNSNFQKQQFLKLNEQNYIYDPTGGYNYHITNMADKKLFHNNTSTIGANITKYLDNIFENTFSPEFYNKYKKYLSDIYEKKIEQLSEIKKMYLNYKDEQYINDKNKKALDYSIKYAKKIGLNIVEWEDITSKESFYDTMINEISTNFKPYVYKLKNINIPHNRITFNENITYSKDIINIYHQHENTYKYLEKENMTVYKGLENIINRTQKNLQRFLLTKYNINMNNRHVSRAWIKMYELYYETKFFDNLDKSQVNSFHICEAPGNFVNSTIYYTKHNTHIQNYNWNAQSLYNGDIFDQYKFIQKTKNNWDFGKDNTGDITSHPNMMYYIEKYNGVDMVVGDCGVPWDTSVNNHKDISSYQLLYALLIPRIGGNFVIKSYASNVNPFYLSMLYTAYQKYDKLFIFKSSRNRWSPEIYIVGIGFKGINTDEKQVLINISKEIQKGNIIYPIANIPTEFCIMYEYYIKKIINSYSVTKKFFVYITRNIHIYDKVVKQIMKYIQYKNENWLSVYMKHLENVVNDYKKIK